MEPHKITKEEYLSLFDENTSKGQYNRTIGKINDRFGYIMEKVCSKLYWFDYTNGHKETDGYFDPNRYRLGEDAGKGYDKFEPYIYFDGEYTIPDPYCNEIPIRWLWEDFEEEFKKEVEQYKIKEDKNKTIAKQKREELKIKKIEMRKVISAKLTKEELKFIRFK